jgi:hypothetical protein
VLEKNALVSVDREYPYGSKHDAFKAAAAAIADAGPSARSLLAVGVPVSVGRPGMAEVNAKLAKRFGVLPKKEGEEIDKDSLPKLFFIAAGKKVEQAVAYAGDKEDGDAIARWAAELAGVFVGLKGQVKEMHVGGKALLKKLASSGAGSDADALLEEVKKVANKQPAETKEYVEYYVKVLEKAAREKSKAAAWLSGEEKRLRRMADDAAVAENKKETLKWRANVLSGLLLSEDKGGKKTEL